MFKIYKNLFLKNFWYMFLRLFLERWYLFNIIKKLKMPQKGKNNFKYILKSQLFFKSAI